MALAYTLQVGREGMEERLGMKVKIAGATGGEAGGLCRRGGRDGRTYIKGR